jgi:thimet oligopeptidase
MQLVRKDKHGFDAKSVREYFPYDRVRDGILALYGEIFGITFQKREGASTWDASVDAWEITREGEVIGRFFLDMHPRADKYKHAAMFPIQTGLAKVGAGAARPSGIDQRLPWASLVCNFPKGSELMDHREVVTFFHEFGHLIHHLLAQQSPWLSTAGINVEWDFVEAPSQLLEEWAWDPKVLAKFAKNDKGKAIPAKLVDAMKKAEEFGKGAELGRQLFYAAYSFDLHKSEVASLDLEAFTSEHFKSWSPYPRPVEDHLYTNFAHLIGYKSAYYTYQWSLAIAKDLFGRFKEKGLLDPEVAADYRRLVLEPGGTDQADNLVRAFLGRERNLDAYREWITR